MAAKKNTVRGIRVTSSVEGFRRGGRAWSKEAVSVPLTNFTKEQLAQIRAEQRLAVEDIEIEAGE